MRISVFLSVLLFALGRHATADQLDSVAENDGWKFSSESNGVKIFSRVRPGSQVKEFRAIGEIDAGSREVHAVIDDVTSYPAFMPYTAECQVLQRGPDSLLTYQRISPKILCDRDYTLRIWEKNWPTADGLTFLNRWEAANASGPAEKPGVLRVKLCEGSWLLEPSGAKRTKATYSVYSDGCGKVPAFVANHFSQVGIREVFAAVRKQVKDPKYSGE